MSEHSEQKPRFLQSADVLAREMGLEASGLLDLIRRTAMSADYPTAECFLPNEVWEYEQTGNMPNGRVTHAGTCVHCRALLSVLSPRDDLVKEFREEVSKGTLSEAPAAATHGVFRKVAVMAAAAVLLCSVGASWWVNRHREDGTGAYVTGQSKEELVIRDASTNQEITIPVEAYDSDRISKDSYARAAAATALVSQAAVTPFSQSIEVSGKSFDELRQKIILALATVCEKPGMQQTGLAQTKIGGSMLEHALRGQSLKVERAATDSSDLDVTNQDATLRLNASRALSSTVEYCQLLHKHNGSTEALDSELQGVEFKLVKEP